MIPENIPVVDDDPKIRLRLRRCLEENGLAVLEAETEEELVKALETYDIGLVTLDIQLGKDNGLEIAKRLRRNSRVPIVMVTGQDEVIDRMVGLEIGADDYIAKPFHVRKVLTRVRAALRRDRAGSLPAQTNDAHSADNITIHSFDGMMARFDQFELF